MRVNAYTVCAFNYVIHLPGEIRQTDRYEMRAAVAAASAVAARAGAVVGAVPAMAAESMAGLRVTSSVAGQAAAGLAAAFAVIAAADALEAVEDAMWWA